MKIRRNGDISDKEASRIVPRKLLMLRLNSVLAAAPVWEGEAGGGDEEEGAGLVGLGVLAVGG